MTWSTERARPRVFAEPLGEHEWRVCRNDAGVSLLDPTLGYIEELGGTYEVRVLAAPTQRQFVPTFKEAMDCFGVEDSAPLESAPSGSVESGSAAMGTREPEPAAPKPAAIGLAAIGLTASSAAELAIERAS